MYDFRETTPFTGADDNQLPAEAMLIDGQYIENLVPGYRTLQVGGRELLKQSATSNAIGISDGETLEYVRNPSREITVGYQLIADDDEAFRTAFYKLSGILHGDTHQVSFNDDLSVYWNAVLTDVDDVPKGRNAITSSFTLFVPDGIAHSVATKTFDNMPYKDIPLNLMAGTSADPVSVTGSGWNIQKLGSFNNPTVGKKYAATVLLGRADFAVSFQLWANDINGNRISLAGFPVTTQMGANQRSTIVCTWPDPGTTGAAQIEVTLAWAFQKTDVGTYQYLKAKLEEGTTYSTWSPNPADAAYYANTIMVHNGGTYPVEPIITATMHADNGMVGIVNDRPGILQFGTQEIDGFTTEESEVALDLAAVQGSHMDNQAATNNPYWGGDPSMPNEQIGNAIWTQDSYDGWKVEPNWPSITGTHLYWNGPSIKHDLAQTHNGDFKSNLTWDVMTRFQTGVAQVGALETTLESDGKPIFQMILKDNSALSDQLWWMCYYKDQLVVNEQLDRSIFTNDKFIQLELQKFGNSVVFRVSPWVGNQGRETTITRQFTFADAASVETKQFSAWFMRDKTWGESTMYLIASTVKWQNVSWYTNIKNRFSDGDVLKIDVANAKTYLNGSLDPTMHTLGNQWEQFKLPPGDTKIAITPSSWAQPFACEVEIREAWL
ncbi:distal tail protein Dit [Lacticaseibacillus rhamnosus]|uniref:Phage tail fiber protein n=8 Tax=Lacticaseibacillus rhamnosus TaxID=47715 RepID=A0AB33XSN9_LACRH|nr:distal tail protein Dit [Lacticaseibacillus rhamnosus]EKS49920.1 Phage tail fiber protein [Lacticaseibacillus rhamnosus LRHMDP3]EKS51242.1 Phage tail fiber protein [Lacticaseibacillus rhamnosus LRHMDP2]MDE3298736.1 phage tail family protein [Lacticaseibacillus rhamnosus]